jgi:hypothetical protein
MPNIDISICRISARAETADKKAHTSAEAIKQNLFMGSPWNAETADS